MTPIPRLKAYSSVALLSYGFRPFFFGAAVYAGVGLLIWLPLFSGDLEVPTTFSPLDWHIHEMLYGYLPAVITGFLLTAIPNWTGRLPLQGTPLAVLFSVWIAGRIAVSLSAITGPIAAGVIDVAFLFLLFAAAAREVVDETISRLLILSKNPLYPPDGIVPWQPISLAAQTLCTTDEARH